MIAKKRYFHLAANLETVLINRRIRQSYTFRYNSKGVGKWIKGKRSFTPEEFDKMYPIAIIKPAPKGGNPDRKKNFLRGEKSY